VSAQDGTVEQVTNYYPFGAPYSDGTSTSVSLQPHKYNGKELDMTHGWNTYDYGARIYDPILCQWTSPDPLTGEYPWVSPYVYCANNPIKYVDPDGKLICPVLYRENNKSGLIPKYYTSMSSFVNAMKQFGKTEWGRHIVSSFVDKGKTHYGVKGNGHYSDITLFIKEFNLNNSEIQTMKMISNGVKISGSLDAMKNDDGELFFEMKIDASMSESAMAETIVHEFTLHGALIDNTIDIYRKKGADEALKFFYKTTGEQDHENNKILYEKTKNELLFNKPEYENAF
jgi:RHS repeat-associated protein